MKLFEMFATLTLDTDKFNKALDDGEKKVTKFSDSYTKGFESLAKGVLKVGATVTAGVGVLASIGVTYNTQMETYTTNFEVMLGSTEKAVKKVEELKKFSQSTPFELGDLANATQTLLAFNVSADDSTSILQMLGDISLGNSQKLETLTRAYGKMSSSQKVSLESINMMIDSGYNPLLTIQEKTGASMEEVYDRITKGTLSFEELEDAMKDATSEGGQFYKGMETASKTTAGMISTAKDLINSKLGEFFQGVSDTIKDMLPKVISFVEELDVSAILGNIEKMYNTFVQWSPVLGAVVGGATALYVAFKSLAIIEMVKGMIEGTKVAMALLNTTMLANPFMIVVTVIGVLVGAFMTLWTTNEDFRNAFTKIWQSIVDFFQKAYDTYFKPIVEQLGAMFDRLWNNSLKPLWDNFVALAKSISDEMQKLWNFIEPVVTAIGKIIGEVLVGAVKYVIEYWTNVISIVSTIFETIATIIFGVINNILAFVRDNWQTIVAFFINPIAGVLKMLYDLNPKFKEWVDKLIATIKNTFLKMADIGKDIVRGLWNGISSMGTWITNKVKDFFGGITKTVKNLFGIKSPSRVFKYFGKMVDEGFIGGVLDGADEINKVMEHTFNGFEPKGVSMFDGLANSSFANVGRAVKNAVNNVVINIDGANDPFVIAQEVNAILGGMV